MEEKIITERTLATWPTSTIWVLLISFVVLLCMDVPDVLFRVLISAKKAAWIPFKQEAVCPHRWPDGIWKDAPLFGDPRSHFQYEKPKTANRMFDGGKYD